MNLNESQEIQDIVESKFFEENVSEIARSSHLQSKKTSVKPSRPLSYIRAATTVESNESKTKVVNEKDS